jgi:hypothetical protein
MLSYFFIGTPGWGTPTPLSRKENPVKELTLPLVLNGIGAIIGSFAACLYALRVWQKIEKANLATWSVIWVLDFVGLYLTYVTGNKEPYIQIGWCFAATLIVIAAWVRKGDWRWTKIESVTLAIVAASVAVWIIGTTDKVAMLALSGYLVACFVSVWPQAEDYRRDAVIARKSAWVWQVSMLSLAFIIVSKWVAGKFGLGDTLVYYALFVLNAIMTAFCVRRAA